MTDDLVKRLRENDFFREDTLYWVVDTGKADALCNQAADHIEALTAENERLREALREMFEAVCGETGFAQAVRVESGVAYPWPALDLAEAKVRAALGDTQ